MSAIGTKRTCRVALHMSAFGGKADIILCTAHVCFSTQSGHGWALRQDLARFNPCQSTGLSRYSTGSRALGGDMQRREFITLVGGAAVSWLLVARAQQPERMRRIGVLVNLAEDDPEAQAQHLAFLQGLQQLGWADGRNVRIDTRWTAATAPALANMRRNWSRLSLTWFWPKAPQS